MQTKEVLNINWIPVKGFEGLYEVNNLGQIKSLNYKRMGIEKILKPAKDKKGYLRTMLTKDGVSKTIKVHRVVCESFLGNVHGKNQVNHIDGVKTNNSINNLEWCDNTENQNHAIKNKLVVQPSGNNHHRTRHSDELILKIYNELLLGASKRELSRKYKVDRNVFKRKIIKNVEQRSAFRELPKAG